MISGGLRGVKESTERRSSVAGPVFVITIWFGGFVTLDETLCYFQGVFWQ
jgi:hypothetical protein